MECGDDRIDLAAHPLLNASVFAPVPRGTYGTLGRGLRGDTKLLNTKLGVLGLTQDVVSWKREKCPELQDQKQKEPQLSLMGIKEQPVCRFETGRLWKSTWDLWQRPAYTVDATSSPSLAPFARMKQEKMQQRRLVLKQMVTLRSQLLKKSNSAYLWIPDIGSTCMPPSMSPLHS